MVEAHDTISVPALKICSFLKIEVGCGLFDPLSDQHEAETCDLARKNHL